MFLNILFIQIIDEIKVITEVIKPLKIYPNQKICQIKFEYTTGNVLESYDQKAGSKYHNQSGVVESQMHKNF